MSDVTGTIGRIDVTVENIEQSVGAFEANGGEVIVPVKGLAGGRFCVNRDPAGAVTALYQA